MQEISVESYIDHHYPKVGRMPLPIKRALLGGLQRLFHEKQINGFLAQNRHKDAFSFIEAVLDYFHVDIALKKNELERIPSYGRVVIVANHPLGALDAMALLYLIGDIRKDIQIVANAFLSRFDNLEELIIPVDNIHGKMTKETVERIHKALDAEKAVVVFPAGEVSRIRPGGVKDGAWKSGFYKIARKHEAPILPIYIEAKNSKSFYFLSMLHRTLGTVILPHEMFKSQGKEIAFTVGNPIPYESYAIEGLQTKEVVKLLRKHFYRVAKNKRPLLKVQEGISLAEAPVDIKNELKNGEILGETTDGKKIVLYESEMENCVIKEIGRLREISFRHVGEGTGKSAISIHTIFTTNIW